MNNENREMRNEKGISRMDILGLPQGLTAYSLQLN
jgi:hypothetical protein